MGLFQLSRKVRLLLSQSVNFVLQVLLRVVRKVLVLFQLFQEGQISPDWFPCRNVSHRQVCHQGCVLSGVHSEEAIHGILLVWTSSILHAHLVVLLNGLVTALNDKLLAVKLLALFFCLPIEFHYLPFSVLLGTGFSIQVAQFLFKVLDPDRQTVFLILSEEWLSGHVLNCTFDFVSILYSVFQLARNIIELLRLMLQSEVLAAELSIFYLDFPDVGLDFRNKVL